MKVNGRPWRSIWREAEGMTVGIIDQTLLPHRFETRRLASLDDACRAISTMQVRGAPLIGATAAYGLALALIAAPDDAGLAQAVVRLAATRPTAVNLRWALEALERAIRAIAPSDRAAAAFEAADRIAEEDVAINRAIGDHGLALIEQVAARRDGAPVRILTHCNAGWLATVDHGTALAPIYAAHERGIALHVLVDETRPRNQGASLTAWELAAAGVPHTVIVDNAGGHYMRQGAVDLCFVGTDRTAANGDVANKIGTYLKALAAHDCGVPFYVCLPSPTIDWRLDSGDQVPIEERDPREVSHLTGITGDGRIETVRLTPEASVCANPAFDVTPARLVTALVTERGIAPASRHGLRALFPAQAAE